MPGMYNHCDQGYCSGTTVCAVERNNKKIEAKSEGTDAFAFCFCSTHLKLSAKDLQLIIEKIKVYEDHLEIRLKADIDCLLRCGELPHEEDFVAAMARQGGTINFPDGTGDISTITIVQSAKMRPDKVFRANVISNGEGRGMSTPAQWSLSACSSRSMASITVR